MSTLRDDDIVTRGRAEVGPETRAETDVDADDADDTDTADTDDADTIDPSGPGDSDELDPS
ncbi:MAG TPA: hypothetical protein VHF67_04095 [Gaiellaceae bacterium]|jgi:hypothetical protein|nr:hypothetical protein [Gaiellaceae bacterium]